MYNAICFTLLPLSAFSMASIAGVATSVSQRSRWSLLSRTISRSGTAVLIKPHTQTHIHIIYIYIYYKNIIIQIIYTYIYNITFKNACAKPLNLLAGIAAGIQLHIRDASRKHRAFRRRRRRGDAGLMQKGEIGLELLEANALKNTAGEIKAAVRRLDGTRGAGLVGIFALV